MDQIKKSIIDIDDALLQVINQNGSDLHLTVGLPPTIRVFEMLQPLAGYTPTTQDEVHSVLKKLLKPEQLEAFYNKKEFDFSYTVQDKGRFRINSFYCSNNMAIAFRLIPLKVPDFKDLNLPPVLEEFCKLPQGLILVTGPTGVGKSSTLAAMINWINNNRNCHVITIEDPLEYLFKSNKALIQQREMYIDTLSWEKAIRSSLREDPDVILVGEMRDRETVAAALAAAETGHVVFATLHTNSAAQTVDRIIGIFPESNQEQTKLQLSATLEGVISQTLVRGKDKKTRYPALEILISNPAVKNTIREGKTHYLDNIINTNYDLGMTSLERALAELVTTDKVELDVALESTLKPEDVIRYAKKMKPIDSSTET